MLPGPASEQQRRDRKWHRRRFSLVSACRNACFSHMTFVIYQLWPWISCSSSDSTTASFSMEITLCLLHMLDLFSSFALETVSRTQVSWRNRLSEIYGVLLIIQPSQQPQPGVEAEFHHSLCGSNIWWISVTLALAGFRFVPQDAVICYIKCWQRSENPADW